MSAQPVDSLGLSTVVLLLLTSCPAAATMLAPCSFASERLVYRACNFPADDAFLLELANDPETQMGWFGGVVRPKAPRDLEGFKTHLQSDAAMLA